jgi:membrane protease YdiL (CAAX protease family)
MDTTPTTLSRTNSSVVDEQHSVGRTLVLHLLPGVLILVFFVAVAPLLRGIGFPPVMAIYLASVFVLIPFELGYLIYQARKSGTTLGHIVLYRQPVPRGQFVLLVGALFVGGSVIGTVLTPVDFFVKENLFSWLPRGYDVTFGLYEGAARYSTVIMLITWVFGLIVNVIVAPVVEEMYFRGYLLPRISRLGAWAPLLNTVLFSLYHFFSPFQNVGRIITLLPVVYAAWWKRSIYLSIAVHVLFNLTASVFALLLILGVFGGLPG